jgi:hypothetical protein
LRHFQQRQASSRRLSSGVERRHVAECEDQPSLRLASVAWNKRTD